MRARSSRPLLAVLALAAPLLLSSSAADPDPGGEEAAVCEAPPANAAGPMAVREKIARLKAEGALPMGDPDVVVLNGRGFNYDAGRNAGVPPRPDAAGEPPQR